VIQSGNHPVQKKLYQIIFESDTRAGWLFDVALIFAIILSVILVCLESVKWISADFFQILHFAEWTITVLFTLEYILRLICVAQKKYYAFSFFGIVDLLSLLPTYLNYFFVGTHYLVVVRVLRLLRIFRILKLTRYVGEANVLLNALKASLPKITVFLFTVSISVIVVGSLMHLIEGPENGFDNIPRSIYWAIVTITTVGFGDITPQTPLGQVCASVLMILGYGIIAVPTGIVTVELTAARFGTKNATTCDACGHGNHQPDALFCRVCGKGMLMRNLRGD